MNDIARIPWWLWIIVGYGLYRTFLRGIFDHIPEKIKERLKKKITSKEKSSGDKYKPNKRGD